jgi:predicted nucleic acid-binding protein
MNVAVDANLVAALFLPLPYSAKAAAKVEEWERLGVGLLAPVLLEYELVTILRKAVVADLLAPGVAAEVVQCVADLEIRCLPPTSGLHRQALEWSERLGHSKSYDGHYLALASERQVELWTADRRLVNAALQAGADWVRWVGAGG